MDIDIKGMGVLHYHQIKRMQLKQSYTSAMKVYLRKYILLVPFPFAFIIVITEHDINFSSALPSSSEYIYSK